MKPFPHIHVLTTCLALLLIGFAPVHGQDADAGKGAIILVSIEGDVKIKKLSTGEFLPAADVAAGKSIFDGHTVIAGEASKAVLLLSNGSITTVLAKSELTFQEFTQKKFEKTDTKVSELEGEPSTSTTKLNLGYGDMVFNVKKLKSGSSFDINSNLGSAGIRGTDGQMSVHVDPDTGNLTGGVNMLSGSVVYTDPSGFQQPVPAGQGTTVNTTPDGVQVGATEQAPVPPETQQSMQETTNEAEAQTSDITVSEVSDAVQEVETQAAEETQDTPEEEEAPAEEEPAESESEAEESTEPETSEETSEEPATEPESEPTPEPEPEPAPAPEPEVDTDAVAEQNLETNEAVEIIQETGEVVETDTELARAIQALNLDTAQKKQLQDYSTALQEKLVAEGKDNVTYLLQMQADEDTLGRFFDYDPATQEGLLAAGDPAHTHTILGLQLPETRVQQTLSFSESVQKSLVLEPVDRLTGILDYGFTDAEAGLFFQYGEVLRQYFIDAGDARLVKALLGLEQSEDATSALLDRILAKAGVIDSSEPGGFAPDGDGIVSDNVVTLLEETAENGNENIPLVLFQEGEGTVDDVIIAEGLLGNQLLTDITLDPEVLGDSRFFDTGEALANRFYQKIALLFEDWILSGENFAMDIPGDPSSLFASRNLTLQPGTLDLGALIQDGHSQYFLTAEQGIHLSGDLVVSLQQDFGVDDASLTLAAGNQFDFEPGSSLTFPDGSLSLVSRSTSEFRNISMEAGGNLAITSLENLLFADTTLKVRPGDSIHLRAFNDISINGMQFSEQLKSIYMQAITLDLQNIYFPAGSTVYLQSQFGGIDGIYPNFGSSQVGRVNFIENVGYDQTQINNRAIFDQFRDQILISPLGTQLP